jgi:hypothetical protein
MNEEDRVKKILVVKEIMERRNNARKQLDFLTSDVLRDQLLAQYYVVVKDQVNGPSGWVFKDGTSKKLPPGMKLPSQTVAKSSIVESSTGGKKRGRKGKLLTDYRYYIIAIIMFCFS